MRHHGSQSIGLILFAWLMFMALMLAGCSTTQNTTQKPQKVKKEETIPRQPSVRELTGKWMTKTDTVRRYILIKKLRKQGWAVQSWAVYDAAKSKCNRSPWTPVSWDGDVIKFRHGTVWDPTFDPKDATITMKFAEDYRVKYQPARRHPAEVCGMETNRGERT